MDLDDPFNAVSRSFVGLPVGAPGTFLLDCFRIMMSLALTNIAAVLPTLAADKNMDTLSILALLAAAPAFAAGTATGAAAAGWELVAASADALQPGLASGRIEARTEHGARGEANLQVCVAQGIVISCRSETDCRDGIIECLGVGNGFLVASFTILADCNEFFTADFEL